MFAHIQTMCTFPAEIWVCTLTGTSACKGLCIRYARSGEVQHLNCSDGNRLFVFNTLGKHGVSVIILFLHHRLQSQDTLMSVPPMWTTQLSQLLLTGDFKNVCQATAQVFAFLIRVNYLIGSVLFIFWQYFIKIMLM